MHARVRELVFVYLEFEQLREGLVRSLNRGPRLRQPVQRQEHHPQRKSQLHADTREVTAGHAARETRRHTRDTASHARHGITRATRHHTRDTASHARHGITRGKSREQQDVKEQQQG